MLRRLRSSLAAKLLLGGLILALVIVGTVSGYLLYSRDQQTRGAALSNSDNRVEVMGEVLQQFTGEQSFSTASDLAAQAPLINALSTAQRSLTVPALFRGSPPVDLDSEILVITDAAGATLYTRAAPNLGSIDATAFEGSQAVTAALSGASCAISHAAGACGVELLSGMPVYSVAVPVTQRAGTVVGVVAYIAPLQEQLSRFSTLFQYPTAFVPTDDPGSELRQQSSGQSIGTTPSAIASAITSKQVLVHATYPAPLAHGGTQQVAGSFVAVTAPDGHTVSGYLGIEVPLSQFIGDEQTDEVTLGVITLFVLLALTMLIIVFVEVVVRRPIRRLERGVARIAGGDYTSPVMVRSKDELGRLAASVNRMRDSIRVYTTEIRDARQRLDTAVERVGNVSRALTTTAGGVDALQREVVRAATGIGGEQTCAFLAERDEDDRLVIRAAYPSSATQATLAGWGRIRDVLGGAVVRQTQPGLGALVAVPMFYQDRVVGALCVVGTASSSIAEDEEDVLVVLANNAAVAMQNARMFEQERETVLRLRELDAMKNDFLSTVQHELRTPLTAILGLSDLIEMCWDVWEESPKLEAVHDIQVAARNLYDIVETIIDFSAVDAETLDILPADVPVAEAVSKAVTLVAERYKGGLPIPVDVEVDASLRVWADPDRFSQVIRALVDNAVKFSDGEGRVIVSARAQDDRGGDVRIDVSDRGIGIPDADQERIFDRFYQVDNTATRRYGGTGMGLALVKRLVDVHRAHVTVQSALGTGTTVTLYWPSSAATGAPPSVPVAVPAVAGEAVHDEAPLPVPAGSAAPVQ